MIVHGDKGRAEGQGQGQHGHHGRTQVQQKERADHSHHQEFFLKFIRKVVHGALDELAAVIGSDYFHALGQTFLQLSQFFTHGVDDRRGRFRPNAAAQCRPPPRPGR